VLSHLSLRINAGILLSITGSERFSDERHEVLLAELGRASTHRKISEQEVNVKQQLVGPRYSGGIIFVLQQPSNFHPYRAGQGSVILSHGTLAVVNEAPGAVTCGSMGQGSQTVSQVDSASYIRPNDRASDYQLLVLFVKRNLVSPFACVKIQAEPSETGKVQSLSMGRDFNKSRITCRHRTRGRVPV
jgi:hypothetical protein